MKYRMIMEARIKMEMNKQIMIKRVVSVILAALAVQVVRVIMKINKINI